MVGSSRAGIGKSADKHTCQTGHTTPVMMDVISRNRFLTSLELDTGAESALQRSLHSDGSDGALADLDFAGRWSRPSEVVIRCTSSRNESCVVFACVFISVGTTLDHSKVCYTPQRSLNGSSNSSFAQHSSSPPLCLETLPCTVPAFLGHQTKLSVKGSRSWHHETVMS